MYPYNLVNFLFRDSTVPRDTSDSRNWSRPPFYCRYNYFTITVCVVVLQLSSTTFQFLQFIFCILVNYNYILQSHIRKFLAMKRYERLRANGNNYCDVKETEEEKAAAQFLINCINDANHLAVDESLLRIRRQSEERAATKIQVNNYFIQLKSDCSNVKTCLLNITDQLTE